MSQNHIDVSSAQACTAQACTGCQSALVETLGSFCQVSGARAVVGKCRVCFTFLKDVADIYLANTCFITSTIMGVVPLRILSICLGSYFL